MYLVKCKTYRTAYSWADCADAVAAKVIDVVRSTSDNTNSGILIRLKYMNGAPYASTFVEEVCTFIHTMYASTHHV